MENIDLERAISMWFNMKYELYNKLDHDDSIYFYYEGHKFAEIRIDKKYKFIYYKWDFRDEFFEVFPTQIGQFKEFITKWVGDTFGLMGFSPLGRMNTYSLEFKIPK